MEKKQGRNPFNDRDRIRNNQLNPGNISRNGGNQPNFSNNPSFQRHGPMNAGGLSQGNYVPRPDRRTGQTFINQSTNPGRSFGGQTYPSRNTFPSGGHPPQNR